MYKIIKLISIFVVIMSTSGFSKFEQLEKNPLSGRVGLSFHNGQYGEYIDNGVLINPISASDSTPLNRWFQWGIHNAYEIRETNLYNILKNVSTDIELDIHSTSVIGGNYQRDWRVKHESGDSFSNCRAHNSSYTTANLSDCLKTIRQFHFDYPNHHVITIRLELKDDALTTDYYHSPAALDALIEEHLGDFLYEPKDLRGNYSSLRVAAKNGWPTLGELTGKVMIVLFDPLTDNEELYDYIVASENDAKAFVSPRTHSRSSVDNVDSPRKFKDSSKEHVVMYCLYADNYEVRSHGPNIMALGRIASTYKIEDSKTPAVAEYRDFFIQRGRGDGETGNRNPNWAYSGRLIRQNTNGEFLPEIVSFATGTKTIERQHGSYCLDIENSSLSDKADVIHSICNGKQSQKFAVIDTVIDYDVNKFPMSRGFLIQAIHTDSDGDANQKIIETQGGCCGNSEVGREVFQYSRESYENKSRPDDQYWEFYPLNGGVQIININSQKCLSSALTSSQIAYCNSTGTGNIFTPYPAKDNIYIYNPPYVDPFER
jgi:hypothetical protein